HKSFRFTFEAETRGTATIGSTPNGSAPPPQATSDEIFPRPPSVHSYGGIGRRAVQTSQNCLQSDPRPFGHFFCWNEFQMDVRCLRLGTFLFAHIEQSPSRQDTATSAGDACATHSLKLRRLFRQTRHRMHPPNSRSERS